LNASGFTVEGQRQTRSIVGWWMLDLATATAGDKFTAGGTLLNVVCWNISHYYIFGSI